MKAAVLLVSVLLLGCSGGDPPASTDQDAGADSTARPTDGSADADASSDAPADATADTGPGVCDPTITCASRGVACGVIDDGCGASLDCGPCGGPELERLEVVASDAELPDAEGRPGNAWGGQQSRIVRTFDGELYTAYFVAGATVDTSEWRVAWRAPGGWKVVAKGLAGREPVHLLAEAGALHVVAFPSVAHLWTSSGYGATLAFTDAEIPGAWSPRSGSSTPYMGAGIDAAGDLCVFESDTTGSGSNYGKPGSLLRACRRAGSSTWQFVAQPLPYRHCYTYVLPQADGTLLWSATRDVVYGALGYTAPAGSFDYVFNEVALYRGNQSDGAADSTLVVVENPPASPGESVEATQRDAFVDAKGRLHVLYERASSGKAEMRHALIVGGKIEKDVLLLAATPTGYSDGYFRFVQDTVGRLYWLYGNGKDVYVHPATSDDGTVLGPPVTLSFAGHEVLYSGISWASPRGGTRISDWVDLGYPSGTSGNEWVYARIRLR